MAIGWTEIIIILLVVLILFGPKRLPELAKSIGKAVNEYKKASNTEPQPRSKIKGKELKG